MSDVGVGGLCVANACFYAYIGQPHVYSSSNNSTDRYPYGHCFSNT